VILGVHIAYQGLETQWAGPPRDHPLAWFLNPTYFALEYALFGDRFSFAFMDIVLGRMPDICWCSLWSNNA
jgi:hypothetical protein